MLRSLYGRRRRRTPRHGSTPLLAASLGDRQMKWLLLTLCTSASVAVADPPVVLIRSYEVTGDAIAASLTGQAGDSARGAVLIQQRQKSLCVLCHSGPFPDPHL